MICDESGRGNRICAMKVRVLKRENWWCGGRGEGVAYNGQGEREEDKWRPGIGEHVGVRE